MEFSIDVSPELEQLADDIAEAREAAEPDASAALRDAVAHGLEQLAAEHGLLGPRPPLAILDHEAARR